MKTILILAFTLTSLGAYAAPVTYKLTSGPFTIPPGDPILGGVTSITAFFTADLEANLPLAGIRAQVTDWSISDGKTTILPSTPNYRLSVLTVATDANRNLTEFFMDVRLLDNNQVGVGTPFVQFINSRGDASTTYCARPTPEDPFRTCEFVGVLTGPTRATTVATVCPEELCASFSTVLKIIAIERSRAD